MQQVGSDVASALVYKYTLTMQLPCQCQDSYHLFHTLLKPVHNMKESSCMATIPNFSNQMTFCYDNDSVVFTSREVIIMKSGRPITYDNIRMTCNDVCP